jgi:hypothetical protein
MAPPGWPPLEWSRTQGELGLDRVVIQYGH